jgi:hypothetical protein
MKFTALFEKLISTTDQFITFVKKRAAGAAKIQASSESKGGYAILTAFHFAGKVKPYAAGLKHATKETCADTFLESYKTSYDKLKNIDNLTQRQFQFITGELEAYGELYKQSTSPKNYE